jgi:delta 1-pyrroline-5-carboxylate dehydrogenase
VKSARKAFESAAWSRMRPLDRARIIETIARKIEDNATELALLESYDNGKAVHHALAVDVPAAVDIFRYMAGWCSKIGGQVNPISGDGRSITPIRCANPSVWSARSCPGTIRWRWRPGRSPRRWRQAAPSCSNPRR